MKKMIKSDSIASVKASDFEKIDEETVVLLLTESEKRLVFQMSLFTNSDTRALGILSASISLGAAAVAVALAGFGFQEQALNLPLVISGSVGVCLTSISAHFAMKALYPKPTKPPGWYPSEFLGDLTSNKPLATIKAELIAHTHDRLVYNKDLKEQLDSSIRVAMSILSFTPLCALFCGALSLFFFHYPKN